MNRSDENPYAAPGSTDHSADNVKTSLSWAGEDLPLISVDGKYLVVAPNVTLPNRCIVTNALVDKPNRMQSLSWAKGLQLKARTGRIRFCVNPTRLRG